ncbi:ABC transporter substrate-binding protein [Xylophilus sp.]|uniref:ABC transporter substrate-binding protein n=1 Tax=Xylophilus sp. TaxID=2653893 RepID=UPI0013B727EF|nr:ABC transporter substrate-binding protein [Xylophilus sp.]KAF1048379.1 MAG: Spermidine/putrescine-binding periplasmic protein [Xylophilus sp.]
MTFVPSSSGRRRFLASSLGAATAGLGFPAIAAGSLRGSGSVVVHFGGGTMGEAQRIAYSEPFEAETGIKVIHQPGVTAGVQRAATLAGAPKHDVANISGGSLSAFEREKLLLPIDYGHWERADRDGYDIVPSAPLYVPAMLYSMVLAYDAQPYGRRKPDSWADLWNVKDFPGRRTLAAGANAADGATYEIALLADGVKPENLYPLDWNRALASLARLRADIAKWWTKGAESVQLLVDRQASIGSAWNGRIDGANDEGARIAKSWNQGILQWSAWAIPKGAPNVENAQKYIAFMSRPEAQARFSEIITYGPTNSRAFRHIKADRALQLPTAPAVKGKQIVQDYAFWNAADASGQNNLRRAISEWERWVAAR